ARREPGRHAAAGPALRRRGRGPRRPGLLHRPRPPLRPPPPLAPRGSSAAPTARATPAIAAVTSLADRLMWRHLRAADAATLVSVSATRGRPTEGVVSYPDYPSFPDRPPTVDAPRAA